MQIWEYSTKIVEESEIRYSLHFSILKIQPIRQPKFWEAMVPGPPLHHCKSVYWILTTPHRTVCTARIVSTVSDP